jgi:hypothetical protein
MPFIDMYTFVADQTPNSPTPPTLHPSTMLLAYQLGNIYLLAMFIGVAVLYTTSEPKVIRNYMIALALGDVGHVFLTCWAIGWAATVDVKGWNTMTWGNVGATTFLLVNRIAYVLGLFGYAKAPKDGKKTL